MSKGKKKKGKVGVNSPKVKAPAKPQKNKMMTADKGMVKKEL